MMNKYLIIVLLSCVTLAAAARDSEQAKRINQELLLEAIQESNVDDVRKNLQQLEAIDNASLNAEFSKAAHDTVEARKEKIGLFSNGWDGLKIIGGSTIAVPFLGAAAMFTYVTWDHVFYHQWNGGTQVGMVLVGLLYSIGGLGAYWAVKGFASTSAKARVQDARKICDIIEKHITEKRPKSQPQAKIAIE